MGRNNGTPSKVTPDIKEAMLVLLQEIPSIMKVRKVFGISRSGLQRAREADEDFDQRIRDARADALDAAEDEAYRRAVEGTVKPVFYKGEQVRDEKGLPTGVREFSDTLLQFILKHNRPRKFNPGAKVRIDGDSKLQFVFDLGNEESK